MLQAHVRSAGGPRTHAACWVWGHAGSRAAPAQEGGTKVAQRAQPPLRLVERALLPEQACLPAQADAAG